MWCVTTTRAEDARASDGRHAPECGRPDGTKPTDDFVVVFLGEYESRASPEVMNSLKLAYRGCQLSCARVQGLDMARPRGPSVLVKTGAAPSAYAPLAKVSVAMSPRVTGTPSVPKYTVDDDPELSAATHKLAASS